MKKLLLLCAAGFLAFSGLDVASAKAKAKPKGKARTETMQTKRAEKRKAMDDALTKIATSIQDVKDEKTKAAFESIYAYLTMKHEMKREGKGRGTGRKPAPRALKKPAKRGAPAPKRKRARFQSED